MEGIKILALLALAFMLFRGSAAASATTADAVPAGTGARSR
jgi:hypothetical protein